MSRRHYGLKLGDKVKIKGDDTIYTVIDWALMDNNRCFISDGVNIQDYVCEWLIKV